MKKSNRKNRLERQFGKLTVVNAIQADERARIRNEHTRQGRCVASLRLENFMLNRSAVFPLAYGLSFYIDTALRVPMYTGDSAQVSA